MAADPVTDVQQTVAVPPAANKIAQAIAKVLVDVAAAKKSGLTGAALIAASASDAIGALADALPAVGSLGAEAAAEPIGVAEAISLAGFQVARSLTGK